MSKNKKGVQISEETGRLSIIANDNFSELSSQNHRIFDALTSDSESNRKIRIKLSSKTQHFQSTVSRIRDIAIKNDLDIVVRVNSNPHFSQTVNEIGIQTISTPYYTAYYDGHRLQINMGIQKRISAYGLEVKEIANLIKTKKPKALEVCFFADKNEKNEYIQRRVQNLIRSFKQHLESVYSVRRASFSVVSSSQEVVVASFEREQNCKKLLEKSFNLQLPISKIKHRRKSGTPRPEQFIHE